MKIKRNIFNLLYSIDKILLTIQTKYPNIWGFIFRRKTYIGFISICLAGLIGQVVGLGFTDFFNELIDKSPNFYEKIIYKILDIYFGGSWEIIFLFLFLIIIFFIGKLFEDKGAFSKKIFSWSFFLDRYQENLNSSIKNKYIPELHTDNELSDILMTILGGEYIINKLHKTIDDYEIRLGLKGLKSGILQFKQIKIHKDYLDIKNNLINHLEVIYDNILSLVQETSAVNLYLSEEDKSSLNESTRKCIELIEGYHKLEEEYIYNNKYLDCHITEEYDDGYGNSLHELGIDINENTKRVANRKKLIRSNLRLGNIKEYLSKFLVDLEYLVSQELHISGSAGVGKTHTLFNVYEKVIKSGYPAIFILGQHLIKNELFAIQIKELLDIPNNLTLDDFLNLLNRQGELYKCKVPIIIDGLNESLSWKNIFRNLPSFITKLKKYRNLVLITSYRPNYEKEIFKDYILDVGSGYKNGNKYIVSQFNGNFDELFDKYIKHYDIKITNTFNRNFFESNLIYLKMFCEVNKGKKVTINNLSFLKIFEKYVEKCNKDICDVSKLDLILDLNMTFTDDKLAKIGLDLWEKNLRMLPLNNIISAIATDVELRYILDEDLLLVKNLNKKNEDSIGFTYDLFGGYVIAKAILNGNKEGIDNFLKSNSIKEKILERKHPLFEDILEGLILILLSENIYIFDYIQDDFVIEKFIEIITKLGKENVIENQGKLLPFLKIQFEGNFKTKIFEHYFNEPFDLDNPININFWHSILFNFTLADRDEIWTIKISDNYYINNWIDDFEKQINILKEKYEDGNEKLLLIGKFFSWFLSTTNNKNRDKITKLLVELFTDKPISYLKLHESFVGINDPYIIQRVLAIGLGVTIRSDVNVNIKSIAEYIYEFYYIKKNLPVDILSRDYIKTIAEYGNKKLGLKEISLDKIKYPYNSEFDIKTIPTFEELEKYSDTIYSGKDGYYDYIRGSVMYSQGHLADFGRYVLGSKVRHWLNVNITDPKIPTEEELEKIFTNSLTSELLDKYKFLEEAKSKDHLSIFIKLMNKNIGNKEECISEKLENEFLKCLDKDQAKNYNQLKDFKNKDGIFGDINGFDTKIAERWIYNRVIKLGYNVEKHGNFDKDIGRMYHNRGGNDIERIGKKYQWIALYELLSRISDNYKFGDGYPKSEVPFRSPQTTYIRDIDPTFISKSNELMGFDEEIDEYLYTGISNKDFIRNKDNLPLGDWVRASSGIPDYKELIERSDNEGTKWIILEGFFSITERAEGKDIKFNGEKQFWNQIKSYLVKKEDFLGLKTWLSDKSFMGRELMPESTDNGYSYLGELYWSEGYDELHVPYYGYQDWTNNYEKLPNKVVVTAENYYSERRGDSIEGNGRPKIILPSKFIAEKLGAKWDDKKSMIIDKNGDVIGFNPINYGVKEESLLLRKDIFLKFLDDNNLEIIFTVLGEKQILGKAIIDRLTINGIYYLNKNGNIDGDYKTEVNNY